MRLTLNLPDDVWHRLANEAADKDKSIGKFTSDLIVKRDARINQPVQPVAPSQERESE